VRIERLLAAGASIKGAARKFAIDYHVLRRHWRNHVSAEARATYVAGAGAGVDDCHLPSFVRRIRPAETCIGSVCTAVASPRAVQIFGAVMGRSRVRPGSSKTP
jgi:hypothetical protein